MAQMTPLAEMRRHLLALHKTLVDAERLEYERRQGRVRDGEFLAALLNDPDLAWLKPLTTLVAQIDEVLDDDEFRRRYAEVLQRSPDAVLAHGRAMRAIQR
jgi:hypothetical protein